MQTNSLSENPYCLENVPLFQAMYGSDLISLGGLAAIDNMFSGLDVRGLKALDIGFGLGGVAFYLIDNYQMIVSGVEVHPWLVEYAKEHAPKHSADKLEFNTYNANNELPHKPNTFDLAYSKGVLNHVADKDTLFRQINTALKPEGIFVIADWIFPHTSKDNLAPLVCETKESYENILVDSGFGNIEFRNDSKIFLIYVKELLKNLNKNRELITERYGKAVFSTIWEEHEGLIHKLKLHQKFATRIVAKKITHTI